MVKKLIILSCFLTFITCNTPNENNIKRLETGMGVVEAEKMLGEPVFKIPDDGGAIWIYYYPYKSYNKRMDVYIKENEVSEIIIY